MRHISKIWKALQLRGRTFLISATRETACRKGFSRVVAIVADFFLKKLFCIYHQHEDMLLLFEKIVITLQTQHFTETKRKDKT